MKVAYGSELEFEVGDVDELYVADEAEILSLVLDEVGDGYRYTDDIDPVVIEGTTAESTCITACP